MRWWHRSKPHPEFTQSRVEKSVSRLPHKQEIAGAEPAPATIATPTETKETTVLDLTELEARLKSVAEGVYSALERDAHTKVGEVLTTAAKQLVAVLPEGAEVENVLNTLETVANVAHAALHTAAAAPDPTPVVGNAGAPVDTTPVEEPAPTA